MAKLLRDNVESERRKGSGEGESSQPRRQESPLSQKAGDPQHPELGAVFLSICGNHRHSEKWKEILTYQALIVSECRRCGGKGWLLYDAAFHQQVTDFAETDFSKLNQSLYLTTWRHTVARIEAVGIVCYQTTHRRSVRCVPNSYTEKVPGERRELVKEKPTTEERSLLRKE